MIASKWSGLHQKEWLRLKVTAISKMTGFLLVFYEKLCFIVNKLNLGIENYELCFCYKKYLLKI